MNVKNWICKYVVKGNVVKFKVKDYSPNSTLIIDPTLIFFTYTGSTADNWGFTATYGPDGSFFSGGIVFGNGFPVSAGAYQTIIWQADERRYCSNETYSRWKQPGICNLYWW